MDLVSIIIPCYNYGHLLPYTLDSIFKQTYLNWEAVIIDDGSNDNTKEIAFEYIRKDNRFKYIYQRNSGPSSARNTGITAVSGEFIIFLDADDLISEEKIKAHMDHFTTSEKIDISYSSAVYFDPINPNKFYKRSSLRHEEWMPKITGNGYLVLKELIKGNIMPVSSPCIRRCVIDQVKEFNSDLKSMEDWEYWLRCAQAGFKFSYLQNNECSTLIRVQKNSLSKNIVRMADYEIDIRNNFFKNWSQTTNKSLTIEELKSLIYLNSLYVCRALMRSGRMEGFINLFKNEIDLTLMKKIEIATVDFLRSVKYRLRG